ncbi:hypothetical protein AD998_10535 [bacterium 336/3]|nr:hypothetical protein AD998_10535 [bacterium 336/3]
MKYYRLYINTDGTFEMYSKITEVLGVQPTTFSKTKFSHNPYAFWAYCVDFEDEYSFDFINIFLDILEPKFDALEKIGITNKDILFWLIYEYDQQCAMEFHPQEMKRLGELGISLNIDCHEIKSLSID